MTLGYKVSASESLERRWLLAAQFYPQDFRELANPSIYEQYIVEWINKARNTPNSVANNLPTANQKEYPSSMKPNIRWSPDSAVPIGFGGYQPLAINAKLQASATAHTAHLLSPSTTGITYSNWERNIGDSTPYLRMTGKGYPNIRPLFLDLENKDWGEGISWANIGTNGTEKENLLSAAGQLFVEQFTGFWDNAENRADMLDPDFQEIGVGMSTARNLSLNLVDRTNLPQFVYLSTIDYATQEKAFVTGVVMTDGVKDDDFYQPGEGKGKVLITVHRAGVKADPIAATETWSAGGYSIPLENGSYVIRADTDWGTMFYKFSIINGKNTKVDFVRGDADDTVTDPLGVNHYLEYYTAADVNEWLNYPEEDPGGGGGSGGGGTPQPQPPTPGTTTRNFAQLVGRTLVVQGTAVDDRVSIVRIEDTVEVKIRGGYQTFDKSAFDYIAVKTYDGNDRIEIGRNLRHNYVEAGVGDDTVVTSNGNDSLYGGPGRDLLAGGDGDDVIVGGKHTDRVFGQVGNDRLYGEDGNDFIDCGSGRDHAFGGNHNDSLFGSNGNDCIYGGDGTDTLVGGNHRDLTLWKSRDSRIAVEVILRDEDELLV